MSVLGWGDNCYQSFAHRLTQETLKRKRLLRCVSVWAVHQVSGDLGEEEELFKNSTDSKTESSIVTG